MPFENRTIGSQPRDLSPPVERALTELMPRESFLFNAADAAIEFSSHGRWWTGFDYANRQSWSFVEPRYVRIAKTTTHNQPDAGRARERWKERGRENLEGGPPVRSSPLLPHELTELSRYSREDARCTESDRRSARCGECKFSLKSRLPTAPTFPAISLLIAS